MLPNLKALVVVLALASVTFFLARPLCLRYMSSDDFKRRRNTWLVLTATAFLSPSFWLYLLVALPVVYHAGTKDETPASLYVILMHVIPPAGFMIPIVGINQLFDLNNYRILAFTILIPLTLYARPGQGGEGRQKLTAPALLVIGYGVLRLVLEMPYESFTNTLRRGFLYYVDVFVLFYYFSQSFKNRKQLIDILASYCLSCAILAPIALFEGIRSWLLYDGVPSRWGAFLPFTYLMRDNTLRAQASAGHSLALGYMMAMSVGLAVYLLGQVPSAKQRTMVMVYLISGLYAAYSRAPWITAIFYVLLFIAIGPKGLSRSLKFLGAGVLVGALALLSPLGGRIINFLPFVGTVDSENVTYRQQLAEVSWNLMLKHPLLGDPFVMQYMESLRQGQGIVDLVNSYAEVVLFSGLVGLFLFLGPYFIGMAGVYIASRSTKAQSPDFSLAGLSILAGMTATLFMMATGSFGTGLSQMYWIFCGLAINYVAITRASPSAARVAMA